MPAAVSKRHLRPSLTIGIGDGQCSLPTMSVYVESLTFWSVADSSRSAANSLSALASATGSPDISCSRSGPKIAFSPRWSLPFTAFTRACRAASGVAKSSCFGAFRGAASTEAAQSVPIERNASSAPTNGARPRSSRGLIGFCIPICSSPFPPSGRVCSQCVVIFWTSPSSVLVLVLLVLLLNHRRARRLLHHVAAHDRGWSRSDQRPAGLAALAGHTRVETAANGVERRRHRRVDLHRRLRRMTAVIVDSGVGGVDVAGDDLVGDRRMVGLNRRLSHHPIAATEVVEIRRAVNVVVAVQRAIVHLAPNDRPVDHNVSVGVVHVDGVGVDVLAAPPDPAGVSIPTVIEDAMLAPVEVIVEPRPDDEADAKE